MADGRISEEKMISMPLGLLWKIIAGVFVLAGSYYGGINSIQSLNAEDVRLQMEIVTRDSLLRKDLMGAIEIYEASFKHSLEQNQKAHDTDLEEMILRYDAELEALTIALSTAVQQISEMDAAVTAATKAQIEDLALRIQTLGETIEKSQTQNREAVTSEIGVLITQIDRRLQILEGDMLARAEENRTMMQSILGTVGFGKGKK